MNLIKKTLAKYTKGQLDRPTYIKSWYEKHHTVLIDYVGNHAIKIATYLR